MNHLSVYNNLMSLCENDQDSEFYYVDHSYDGQDFRVFSYRLASYTKFMQPDAMECRGIVFNSDKEIVSLPTKKFFNLNENPYTMDLNSEDIIEVFEKLDGSLISTVKLKDGFTLKSKTSFQSTQAFDARKILFEKEEYSELKDVFESVCDKISFDMEYTSPLNRIVIGYAKPELTVLLGRKFETGEYLSRKELEELIPSRFLVKSLFSEVKDNLTSFVNSVDEMEGIEGFIYYYRNKKIAKHKTKEYFALHRTKDSINNIKSLFEVVIRGGSDDLKSLFFDDKVSMKIIEHMEKFAFPIYNHFISTVETYYNENKDLSQKDYAVKANSLMEDKAMFNTCMSKYNGKEYNYEDIMVKCSANYLKDYEEPTFE